MAPTVSVANAMPVACAALLPCRSSSQAGPPPLPPPPPPLPPPPPSPPLPLIVTTVVAGLPTSTPVGSGTPKSRVTVSAASSSWSARAIKEKLCARSPLSNTTVSGTDRVVRRLHVVSRRERQPNLHSAFRVGAQPHRDLDELAFVHRVACRFERHRHHRLVIVRNRPRRGQGCPATCQRCAFCALRSCTVNVSSSASSTVSLRSRTRIICGVVLFAGKVSVPLCES